MKLFNLNLKRTDIAILLAYFGYLLYYIGRRYIEGYYDVLGIPSSSLQLEFHDYIYWGAHPIQFLLAIAFVFLLIGLYRFANTKAIETDGFNDLKKVSFWRALSGALKQKESRKNILTVVFFLYEFGFGTVGLIYIVFLWELSPPKSSPPFPPQTAIAITTIMLVFLTAGFGIIAMWFDKIVLSFIRAVRFFTNYFYVATIIVLVVMPHYGAFSWGVYTGGLGISPRSISSHFNHIDIIYSKPLANGLDEAVSSASSNTSDDKYLIFENKDFLFVKSRNNLLKTITIPKTQVISFTLTK